MHEIIAVSPIVPKRRKSGPVIRLGTPAAPAKAVTDTLGTEMVLGDWPEELTLEPEPVPEPEPDPDPEPSPELEPEPEPEPKPEPEPDPDPEPELEADPDPDPSPVPPLPLLPPAGDTIEDEGVTGTVTTLEVGGLKEDQI